jgi:hypothetical protein
MAATTNRSPDSGPAAGSPRKGVPAWIFFTAAVLLTVICLLALGFARAHVEAEGGEARSRPICRRR